MTTRAPAAATPSANVTPSPHDAPVTTTTRPVRSNNFGTVVRRSAGSDMAQPVTGSTARSVHDAEHEWRQTPSVLVVVRVGDSIELEPWAHLDAFAAHAEIHVATVRERRLGGVLHVVEGA